jgi:hypothetical protein
LPHPHVVELRQVIENTEYISDLRRAGKLDMAAADALISDQRLVRDALVEDNKHDIARNGPPNQVIEIRGGLPPLPLGPTDQPVIMPVLNGTKAQLTGCEPLSLPKDPGRPALPPKSDGDA